MNHKGNIEILDLHKTAFLCSQKCPVKVVLKSYNWVHIVKYIMGKESINANNEG